MSALYLAIGVWDTALMAEPDLIYSTWHSKGYIEGCCTGCGFKFKVTVDEIPNEREAKQALDHKFLDHNAEKHSG